MALRKSFDKNTVDRQRSDRKQADKEKASRTKALTDDSSPAKNEHAGRAVKNAKVCKAVRDNGEGRCMFLGRAGAERGSVEARTCSLNSMLCAEITWRRGKRDSAVKAAAIALKKRQMLPGEDANTRLVIVSALQTIAELEAVNFDATITDKRFGTLHVVPRTRPSGTRQLTVAQFSHLAASLAAFPGATIERLELEAQPDANSRAEGQGLGDCYQLDCEQAVGTTLDGRVCCRDGHEQVPF